MIATTVKALAPFQLGALFWAAAAASGSSAFPPEPTASTGVAKSLLLLALDQAVAAQPLEEDCDRQPVCIRCGRPCPRCGCRRPAAPPAARANLAPPKPPALPDGPFGLAPIL